MRRYNLLHGELDRASEDTIDGFDWRETWVAAERLGAEKIGGSLYELPPGERTFPYHFHYGNEEWLLVVTGEPTLRTPEGERPLRPGDVVCFPAGPEGAHQLRNDASEPTRLFLLSTLHKPDVIRYVDSDKLGPRPGVREDSLNFLRGDAVGYWEGEQ